MPQTINSACIGLISEAGRATVARPPLVHSLKGGSRGCQAANCILLKIARACRFLHGFWGVRGVANSLAGERYNTACNTCCNTSRCRGFGVNRSATPFATWRGIYPPKGGIPPRVATLQRLTDVAKVNVAKVKSYGPGRRWGRYRLAVPSHHLAVLHCITLHRVADVAGAGRVAGGSRRPSRMGACA